MRERYRGKIEAVDLRAYGNFIEACWHNQTLIYCGDIFGELNMPGCAELDHSEGGESGRYYAGQSERRESITA